ncbi:ADP-ribosylglycohydrolase [Fusibacter tunisiensis]|uniref:ADP-ribosylglycohydrolase n=2 Tax=Fusibacter tunisiensis TaxID=1008308 RepID=A0ABS2MTI5_9FIRM|nr:ADP-ribosylglycohydrolase [Fusibacter tunisiensis]
MIGAIIGDIVGSRFEFNNHKSKEFEFFTDECFVTDDSIMTLAVAKALMETERAFKKGEENFRLNNDYLDKLAENAVIYMQSIGRKYPNCGYGGRFGQWIFSENPCPYESYGNGAAMRISPVAEIAESVEELKALSKAVTGVSHNHVEGLKGAEATAMAIFLARTGHGKDKIRKVVSDQYYNLDFCLDDIRATYRFNETCQETVPQAIQAFLESESFEETIRNAISLGGDSDTLAAIAGSIADAYYGVPDAMVEKALEYLEDEFFEIYDEWNKTK